MSTLPPTPAGPRGPRALGPFQVPPIGLGCMNLSHAYGTPPPADVAERLLLEALDLGVTLFDTAALYGFGANETLVGRVLKAAPPAHRAVQQGRHGRGDVRRRHEARHRRPARDHPPRTAKTACAGCRPRSSTSITCIAGTSRCRSRTASAKCRGWCRKARCARSACRRCRRRRCGKAHAVHPIAALQTEYSLWTRNPEIAVLGACRDIGAAFVAFSPVARGFLTRTPPDVAMLDAQGHPPQHAALPPRALGRQPAPAAGLRGHRRRSRLHAGATGAGLAAGARRARDPDPRHVDASSICATTSARPRWRWHPRSWPGSTR